jgi:hypothetical protein
MSVWLDGERELTNWRNTPGGVWSYGKWCNGMMGQARTDKMADLNIQE